MRIRITALQEKQLNECLKNAMWGSKTNSLKDWQLGDVLIICVDQKIAAVAKISGEPLVSDEWIWSNGLFPYRLPLTFTHYFKSKNRIPFDGKIKEMFYKEYGQKYGLIFLNKMLIKPRIANYLSEIIEKNKNDIEYI